MDHPIKRPSYEKDISDLFTPRDRQCMAPAIDLGTYHGVKAAAGKISEWIGSGRMPPPDTGREWAPEKLQTFRNWASNTGYAEKPFVRVKPSVAPRVRKSLHEIDKESEEFQLLKKAFEGIMARDENRDDPTSFFNLAGIHWLPGPIEATYCRHHDDTYNPWHRAYLFAFEDALRSVEGCESVTLPYWNILGDVLPDWISEPPFGKYAYAHSFTSLDGSTTYNAGDETKRDSAAQVHQNVTDDEANIRVKIGEALASDTWRGFNGWSDWPNVHEGIIRAHDHGHDACGETIRSQDITAFDPLFWFFHCNWDRLWWKWQTDKQRTTLLSFKEVVTGDDHWLDEAPDTLLVPFDVNAAEMIDLASWNVDYEHPSEPTIDIDDLLVAARGSILAERNFRIPTTERYSVRVKDINRLDIPGSFEVVLYAGVRVLGRTRIFQPSTPRDCENCKKHGVFSTDFIVEKTDLPSRDALHVSIEMKGQDGQRKQIPLSQAGNPTVNIRVLLDAG